MSIVRAIRDAIKRKKPVASQQEAMIRQISDANDVLAIARNAEWPAYQRHLEMRLGRTMHEVFTTLGTQNREALFCKIAEAAAIYVLLLEPDHAARVIEAAKPSITKPKV